MTEIANLSFWETKLTLRGAFQASSIDVSIPVIHLSNVIYPLLMADLLFHLGMHTERLLS